MKTISATPLGFMLLMATLSSACSDSKEVSSPDNTVEQLDADSDSDSDSLGIDVLDIESDVADHCNSQDSWSTNYFNESSGYIGNINGGSIPEGWFRSINRRPSIIGLMIKDKHMLVYKPNIPPARISFETEGNSNIISFVELDDCSSSNDFFSGEMLYHSKESNVLVFSSSNCNKSCGVIEFIKVKSLCESIELDNMCSEEDCFCENPDG